MIYVYIYKKLKIVIRSKTADNKENARPNKKT